MDDHHSTEGDQSLSKKRLTWKYCSILVPFTNTALSFPEQLLSNLQNCTKTRRDLWHWVQKQSAALQTFSSDEAENLWKQTPLLHCPHVLVSDRAPRLEYISGTRKKKNIRFRKWCRSLLRIPEKWFSKLYRPAVSCHTFVAAVLFVPVVALHGRVVAARPHAHAPQSSTIARAVHLDVVLKIGADLDKYRSDMN